MMNKNSEVMLFDKRHHQLKLVIVSLMLIFSGVNGYSQKLCGTEITPEKRSLEMHRIASERTQTRAATANAVPQCCLGKTLSITFWIVKDSSGQANVSPAALTQAVADLNTYYAPICLSFNACSINYIDDWNFDSLYFPNEGEQIYTLYQVPKTINVYLTRILLKSFGEVVCGLGALPPGDDAIWMSKGCLGGKTFPHEMGHFLGLYHTFETSFGAELADESNCATTGDLICDTPADPGGSNSADCQLSPYTQDSNGDWYVPQIGNIMSYYSDNCACGFTTQQYDRMCQQYLTFRFYLW
jgi:hypothetical protein